MNNIILEGSWYRQKGWLKQTFENPTNINILKDNGKKDVLPETLEKKPGKSEEKIEKLCQCCCR